MHDTQGTLFWCTPEAYPVLDVAHAMGKGRVPVDVNTVNQLTLLETQGGGAFGPVSIKSDKIVYNARSTNFGPCFDGSAKINSQFVGHVPLQVLPVEWTRFGRAT